MSNAPDQELDEQLKSRCINWNYINNVKLVQICTSAEAKIYKRDCRDFGLYVKTAYATIKEGGIIEILAISDHVIKDRQVERDINAWLRSLTVKPEETK